MLFLERDLGEGHLLMGFLGGASGKKPAVPAQPLPLANLAQIFLASTGTAP